MLLASVQEIRENLGFDDMTDINAAIEMALHAAEPQLASILGTSFERTEQKDVFWVYEPPFSQGAHVQTEFRLSRGLLSAAPSIKLSNLPSLFTQPGTTDLSDVMVVDLGKGIARDWSTRYSQQYVEFSYTAGFEKDDANTESFKLSQVPEWLQEAAKLKALSLLTDTPALTEAGVHIDKKMLDTQYASLINRHIRYAPSALLPM